MSESTNKKTFTEWLKERNIKQSNIDLFSFYLAGLGRVNNEEVTEEEFDVYYNDFKFTKNKR